jgi:hypothetical protein
VLALDRPELCTARRAGTVLPVGSYASASRTTRELLADWVAIMRALRERGVIRTNNNPVGDIAEAIVHAYYGGDEAGASRGGFSQAGWDVLTPDGQRIQVKALRKTATGKRRNVSPIRDRAYDQVVIVIFREDFSVETGLRMARNFVEQNFRHRPYVNGRVITITDRLLACPEVERLALADSMLDA